MIQRIREKMMDEGIDCLIMTKEANLTWALGKRISGYFFLTQGRQQLVAPRFYRYQTEEMHAEYAFSKQDYEDILEEKKDSFTGEICCDEKNELLEKFFELEETDLIQELRKVKQEKEIEKIKKACRITDEAFEYIRPKIFSGIDEFEAMADINTFYAERGVEEAFLSQGGQSLVQANSMKPHRPPQKREIRPEDLVILDTGCRYENYCSDVTRTYCQNPGQEQRRLFQDVKEIQQEMIEMVEPGRPIKEIKEKEFEMAEERGYEPEKHILYFGHCIGVEAHEPPSISHTEEGELEEGMVLTIEPGLHVPDIGGARIEDVVLVTDNGREVLSSAPKKL